MRRVASRRVGRWAHGGDQWLGRKDYAWLLLDVERRTTGPLNLPRSTGDVVAVRDGSVIYWGRPTTGTPVQFTKNNSALRGPKLMLSIKVADVETGRFATLMPYLDPRRQVVFGIRPTGRD